MRTFIRRTFSRSKLNNRPKDNYKGKEAICLSFRDSGRKAERASLPLDRGIMLQGDELLGVVGSTPGSVFRLQRTTTGTTFWRFILTKDSPSSFTATAETRLCRSGAQKRMPARTRFLRKKKKKRTGEKSHPCDERRAVRLGIASGRSANTRATFNRRYKHTRPGVIAESAHQSQEPLREGTLLIAKRLYISGLQSCHHRAPESQRNKSERTSPFLLRKPSVTPCVRRRFEVQRLASTTSRPGTDPALLAEFLRSAN